VDGLAIPIDNAARLDEVSQMAGGNLSTSSFVVGVEIDHMIPRSGGALSSESRHRFFVPHEGDSAG
jgi:hypothetical protein